jgi:hypothetical protein
MMPMSFEADYDAEVTALAIKACSASFLQGNVLDRSLITAGLSNPNRQRKRVLLPTCSMPRPMASMLASRSGLSH